jgi:hypothetical protein
MKTFEEVVARQPEDGGLKDERLAGGKHASGSVMTKRVTNKAKRSGGR